MNIFKFSIPAQLNGTQLKEELGCDEVTVIGDELVIVGDLTQAQVKVGLAAHSPAPIIPPTAAEKLLNATGLTVAEYKGLGL